MRIAIQGIAGSFHDIAARRYFAARYPTRRLEIVECESFAETFDAVASGLADRAMVAVENTIAGTILGNYALLERSGLSIQGEIYVRIQHHLVALAGQSAEEIHTVLGHPVAIPQCAKFLQGGRWKVEESADTASAAKRIRDEKLIGVAAIAGYAAADLYGLSILSERIEDQEHNYTRFLALGPEPNRASDEHNKATIALRVSHQAGALSDALNILKHHHINLTKIQSIPVVDVPFEYAITLDLVWEEQSDLESALEVLRGRALEIRLFGVYRQGESDLESMAQPAYRGAIEARPSPAAVAQQITLVEPNSWSGWVDSSSSKRPEFLLIAGPCSAESREQLLDSARALAETGYPCLLRAGIWKPRTRAGGFEGNGIEALKWLREAKAATGLRTAVEVAGAAHVEACLAHGVDAVWIGARTTGNPFSVQEIADVLRGSDVPVLVKNPISPDLELWIGAIERLWMAGVRNLAAIHRGFSAPGSADFRNPPEWSIALQFRRRLPHVPLICDPSHICGRRDLLESVAQRAIDLGMDGLMIEVHPDPASAWTDSAQQLAPADYASMMDRLTWRPTSHEEDALTAGEWQKLETLRSAIDRLDQDLLELLSSRFDVVRQIGEYKQTHGLDVVQPDRWRSLMQRRLAQGERLGLRGDLVRGLFDQVHEESLSVQSAIENSNQRHSA